MKILLVNFEHFLSPTNGDQRRWKQIFEHLKQKHEVKVFISNAQGDTNGSRSDFVIFDRATPISKEDAIKFNREGAELYKQDQEINTNFGFDQALTANLEHYFCPLNLIPTFVSLIEEFAPDIVYFNYPFFRRLFKYVPVTSKIIVDLPISFHQKNMSNAKQGYLQDPGISLEQEISMLRGAHGITFSHPDELKLFDTPELTNKKCFFFTSLPEVTEISWPDTPTVAFTASGGNMNSNYIRAFRHICWPKIKQEIPEAKLLLIGKCVEIIPDSEDVIKVAHSDNMEEEYKKATCIINPVRAGAGMKMKVCEAIASKKPLITFPDHIENVFTNNMSLVARNWSMFAKAVVHALKNHTKFDDMRSEQHHFWKQWLSPENCYKSLDQLLEEVAK